MREELRERSGYVLVVEDYEPWAKRVAFWVGQVAPVRVATMAVEARTALVSEDAIVALVVDIGLPDGCGLALLADARRLRGDVPALVVSALDDDAYINRAYRLDARVLRKTADPTELRDDVTCFVRRATGDAQSVRAATEHFIREHRLTKGEAKLVRTFMRGVARKELADVLQLAEDTVKGPVRRVLTKSGLMSLEVLRGRILAAAKEERERNRWGLTFPPQRGGSPRRDPPYDRS